MLFKGYIRVFCGLISALLIGGLAGCKPQAAPASSEPEAGAELISVPPALDVNIGSLLTIEQVSEAVGRTMEGPQVFEDGTSAHYATADNATTADINMDKVSREIYDTKAALIRETYGDGIEEVPNLTDDALWNTEMNELVLYGKGYIIGITVDIADARQDNENLLASRQLAALLLERLS